MKMVKNIAIVAFAASFMFAGVGFHYANNYTAMDSGTNVETSYGVTYDLNDNTSVGWDSSLGMMMYFDAPAGVTLRLGWTANVAGTVTAASCSDDISADEAACGLAGEDWTPEADDNNGFAAETSVGLGYTWWTGGTGLKTSISTNYDYVMAPGAGKAGENLDATQLENGSNLSVVVSFGF
jgi:hypothetical protein